MLLWFQLRWFPAPLLGPDTVDELVAVDEFPSVNSEILCIQISFLGGLSCIVALYVGSRIITFCISLEFTQNKNKSLMTKHSMLYGVSILPYFVTLPHFFLWWHWMSLSLILAYALVLVYLHYSLYATWICFVLFRKH